MDPVPSTPLLSAETNGPPTNPAITPRQVITRAIASEGRGAKLAAASVGFTGHQVAEALVPVVIGAVIDRAVATSDAAALGKWILVLGILFTGLLLSWRFAARISDSVTEHGAHRLRMDIARRGLDPHGMSPRRMSGEVYSIATSDAGSVAGFTHTLSTKLAAACRSADRRDFATGDLGATRPARHPRHSPGAGSHAGGQSAARTPSRNRSVAGRQGRRASRGSTLRTPNPLRNRRRRCCSAAVSGSQPDFVGSNPFAHRDTKRCTPPPTLRSPALSSPSSRTWADGWQRPGASRSVNFVAVVGLAQFLRGPLIDIIYFGAGLARARASANRVAALLGTTEAVTPAGEPVSLNHSEFLTLRDVVLAGASPVDLDVKRGEIIGIVTENAAWADALVDALARRIEPSSGTIHLGDNAIHELHIDELRTHVLAAPHDAALFIGTVGDNIDALAPIGSRNDEAIAAAAADQVISALPLGLATRVTEQGNSLSGGQRQRIALARALASEAPVLVLHDPTTAVDSVTEARIARGIAEVRGAHATILLTSSPVLLDICDRVIEL